MNNNNNKERMNSHLSSVIKDLCRWKATREPDLIDKKLKDPNSILKSEVMQFLSPVTACINQIWFQLSMLAFGIWLFVEVYETTLSFSTYGISRYRTIRLDMMIHGQNHSDVFAHYPPASGELHILRAGCSIASDSFMISPFSNLSSLATIIFSDETEMDGFSISVNKTNLSMSTRFMLLGLPGSGEGWTRFGQTTDLRKLRGEVRFLDSDDNTLFTAGRANYDLRAPWPLYAESSMSYIVLCCSCLSIAILGFRKQYHFAKVVLMAATMLMAAVAFVAGVGYCFLGLWRESFTPLLDTLIYLLLFVSISLNEKWFFDCLIALSIVGVIGAYFQDCVLFHDCSHFLYSPPSEFFVFVGVGMAFLALRSLSLLGAVMTVSRDRVRFRVLWEQVQFSSCEEARALRDLASAASDLACACDLAQSRQYNRRQCRRSPSMASTADVHSSALSVSTRPASELGVDWGQNRFHLDHTQTGSDDTAVDSHSSTLPGTWDPARPVISLDQLYTQALGVSSALLAHAAVWAAGAGGALDVEPADPCYPAKASDHGAHAQSAGLLPPSAVDLIRRRAMKAPARAVEKALTCYAGDVSRLMDICRCRVLFESVQDVLRCIQIIHSELARRTVRIVRIKNGLDDQDDAWSTAGFRGFVINLVFISDEAKMLGAENHICELQLVLRSYLAMVDELSHDRYLRFRAVRDFSWIFRLLHHRDRFSSNVWPAPLQQEYTDKQGSGSATECLDQPAFKIGSVISKSFEDCPERREQQIQVVLDVNESHYETERKGGENGDFKNSNVHWYNFQIPKRVFERSALNPGNILDHQLALIVNAVEHSSSETIWFTSTPLTTASSRPVFQFLYLGFIAYFLFRSVSFFKELQKNALFEADAARFEILESSHLNSSGYIREFGLVLNGCKIPGGTLSTLSYLSLQCKYDNPVQANGYYFTTSEPSGQDSVLPVRWIVGAQKAASSYNSTWISVGASGWQCGSRGEMKFLSHLGFELPIIRGKIVVVDNRFTWPTALLSISGGIEWVIGLASCLIFSRLRYFHWIRSCFVCCSCFNVLVVAVSAIGYFVTGYRRAAVERVLNVWTQFTLAYGIYRFEAKIVHIFVAYGFQFWLVTIIKDLVIYQKSGTEALLNLIPSIGTTTIVLGIGILFFRRRALKRAYQLVESDMKRYKIAWLTVKDSDCSDDMLKKLEMVVSKIEVHPTPKQLYCTVQHSSEEALSFACQASLNHACPVKSLDQLFVQAMCMHPILLHKITLLSVRCNGLFPTDLLVSENISQKRFINLNTADAEHVKFAKLKSVTRAIEKLVRSYKQEVCQLVDVCRQSIVFEKIADLVMCLHCFLEDKDIIILRVKNRLSRDYKSSCSAGYRDVSLNLRINSAETLELGVYMHICEVQLILVPFAEIKSDEGHERYVTFRNLRGE